MLGSTESGPSTVIISSFSESHCRSWGSAVWKASRFRLERSRCCFLSSVQEVTSSQAASER